MKTTAGGETLESMSQAVWYNQWTLNKFKQYLKGEILEVGCGIGNFTKSLINYGQVYAFDINTNYIEETRKLMKGQVKVGFGDIEKNKFFFGSEQFDSIICLNVLEHIKDDKQALKNLYKLLKDKGYLILLVPIDPNLYSRIDQAIGHLRRYKEESLIQTLKRLGFKVIKSRRINFLGAVGWYVAGRILGKDLIEQGKIKLFNFLAPIILLIEDLIEPPIGTSVLIISQKIKGNQL